MSRGFGSDNHATVHPQILRALGGANEGHAPSYGTDELSETVRGLFQKEFGPGSVSYLVFNGSAANILALRAISRPWQSLLCSDVAHIHMDECAGPEFFTGCKLWPVRSQHGKLTTKALDEVWQRRGDQHFAQAAVLSITQPTELGTVYTRDELKTLIDWGKARGLKVHIDGARLAVAARRLNLSFREFTTDLGADVVSFGGTKNGLMMGEAVIFREASLATDFQYIRKQSGQLPSKTRFIAAQFAAYFENDLWKEMADHSLRLAQRLEAGVRQLPGVEITHPVESNAVFAKIPKDWVTKLREKHFFYVWDEKTYECRWMTSWDLAETDVEAFIESLKTHSLRL